MMTDSKKASHRARARRTVEAPGNFLARIGMASKVTGDDWLTSEFKEKLESFRLNHPRLYRLLDKSSLSYIGSPADRLWPSLTVRENLNPRPPGPEPDSASY